MNWIEARLGVIGNCLVRVGFTRRARLGLRLGCGNDKLKYRIIFMTFLSQYSVAIDIECVSALPVLLMIVFCLFLGHVSRWRIHSYWSRRRNIAFLECF